MSEEKIFSSEQLGKALFDLDDLLVRCALQNTYFLLHETAKCAKENKELSGDGVDVGIEARYITPEVVSTLSAHIKDGGMDEKGIISYEFEGVPVRIKIIKRNYKFLKHPDSVVFMYEGFRIPNPFDGYWKSRFLVR